MWNEKTNNQNGYHAKAPVSRAKKICTWHRSFCEALLNDFFKLAPAILGVKAIMIALHFNLELDPFPKPKRNLKITPAFEKDNHRNHPPPFLASSSSFLGVASVFSNSSPPLLNFITPGFYPWVQFHFRFNPPPKKKITTSQLRNQLQASFIPSSKACRVSSDTLEIWSPPLPRPSFDTSCSRKATSLSWTGKMDNKKSKISNLRFCRKKNQLHLPSPHPQEKTHRLQHFNRRRQKRPKQIWQNYPWFIWKVRVITLRSIGL